jgi:hypothetical protein
MMVWSRHLLAMATLAIAQASMAGEAATFESCTDVAGHTVNAVVDDTQATLIRSTYEAGQPTIRYNPSILPNLGFAARQFFYAHECARHALGDAAKATLPVTRARQADCVALATLVNSELLKREDIPDLQSQLIFSEKDWEALPGPSRSFNLSGCRTGGVLRLPAATSPGAGQVSWNACVRACADRLWTCQKGCRGEACSPCTETHSQCEKTCGGAQKAAL